MCYGCRNCGKCGKPVGGMGIAARPCPKCHAEPDKIVNGTCARCGFKVAPALVQPPGQKA